MSDQLKLILIIVLAVTALIIIAVLVHNTRKTNVKRDFDELNVRFNAIRSTPLAFKLNKAQAMAKRTEDAADKVKVYYEKYEDAQKHIDQIASLMETIEDQIANHEYKDAKEGIIIAEENIEDSEKEVADIDKFLEQFQEKEAGQRENSNRLKEIFRELKLYVNSNANSLSIAYEGMEKRIEKVEELFSQSEEFMYINDYANSQKVLGQIDDAIKDIREAVVKLPELISDTKGVIPTMLDEVNRQYALTRQRGVFTEHLKLDLKLDKLQNDINEDVRTLMAGNTEGVEEHNRQYKEELNELLATLSKENKDFQSLKGRSDEIADNIAQLRTLHNYVEVAYNKDNQRFGLEDLRPYLEEEKKAIDLYQASYMALNEDIADNSKAASDLMATADELFAKTEADKEKLTKYKADYDRNTTDEERAKTQLIKLQVVLNEVEVKVREYRLPAIADSYKDDLSEGRARVATIKELLAAVPLDIEKLNSTLEESIDFIYKFYNNVNNVVGMASMVENAIVFGNKYRSSYPEVERDLSMAEFSYLNGEYTKALTMTISCMEKLFPNSEVTNYLENS